MESYAVALEQENAFERLDVFASLSGPRFDGREPNEGQLKLGRQAPTTRSLEFP